MTSGPTHTATGSSESVHVLFMIDQLCGVGGAEVALMNSIRWLPRDRFRCSVITFRTDKERSIIGAFPCPVQVVPLARTYDLNAVRQGFRVVQFIVREKVDIVHTFFASSDLWGGVLAKLSRRPALVSSRRDMGFLRSARHNRAYRFLAPMFDKVLTVSEGVRNFTVAQDGIDPRKVSTIYNGVDVDRIEHAELSQRETFRRLHGIPDDVPLVAAVGNLRAIKGFDTLIRTAGLVSRRFPNAMFVIAGGPDPAEPACLDQLLHLAKDLGLEDRVKFLGVQANVVPLLKASNVFCLLSRSEGFSNALIEAMACGLPCVATDVGGNREAVQHESSGFLVPRENAEEAASRLCELLRDPEKARRMGQAARRFVTANLAPQVVTAQLVNIYESLLRSRAQ